MYTVELTHLKNFDILLSYIIIHSNHTDHIPLYGYDLGTTSIKGHIDYRVIFYFHFDKICTCSKELCFTFL